MDKKACTKCGVVKPLDGGFYLDPRVRDGRGSRCKECLKAYNRSYRAANPEKVRKSNRNYQAANPEKVRKRNQRRSKDPVYQLNRVWYSMLSRCNNPNDANYHNYGGRGIEVCARWDPTKGGSFENFLEDMGLRPSKELTIDRIDNDKGYEPGNVQWATQAQQNANQRSRRTNAEYDVLQRERGEALAKVAALEGRLL